MPEFGSLRATSAATASGFITLDEELLPITHLIGAIFSRRSNLYRAIPRYCVDLRLTFWPLHLQLMSGSADNAYRFKRDY